jgi:hypothetical protein
VLPTRSGPALPWHRRLEQRSVQRSRSRQVLQLTQRAQLRRLMPRAEVRRELHMLQTKVRRSKKVALSFQKFSCDMLYY